MKYILILNFLILCNSIFGQEDPPIYIINTDSVPIRVEITGKYDNNGKEIESLPAVFKINPKDTAICKTNPLPTVIVAEVNSDRGKYTFSMKTHIINEIKGYYVSIVWRSQNQAYYVSIKPKEN